MWVKGKRKRGGLENRHQQKRKKQTAITSKNDIDNGQKLDNYIENDKNVNNKNKRKKHQQNKQL